MKNWWKTQLIEIYLVHLNTVAAVVAAAVVAVDLNCSNKLCLLNSLFWTFLNHLYPIKYLYILLRQQNYT